MIEGDAVEFNLKPRDTQDEIPEEQRTLSHGIYGAAGVLKLLNEQKVFDKDQASLKEFRERLLQVAQVGLAASHVKSKLAATALDQIRDEIVLRKGRPVQFRYLLVLLQWAGLGAVVAGLVVAAAEIAVAGLRGYGWVLMGSMAGAWMSVAAGRREISFEELPYFLDSFLEPIIRLVFVGLLAVTVALFLHLDVLSISFLQVDFSEFAGNVGVALLLGVVAGIGERTLSVRLVKRAQEVVTPTAS